MSTAPTQVIAVRYGELVIPRSEAFIVDAPLGTAETSITLAYYFWVIFTPGRTVVVDTGFDSAVGIRRGRDVLITVPEALERMGIDPNDELDVVLTHAHYDHAGNVRWFRNATVYMARAEYDYWSSQDSMTGPARSLVEEDELTALTAVHRSGRLRLIDGDTQIAPGIRLLLAPGHTPGELMVHVETLQERILLTSDAVHFDEELEHGRPFRHMWNLPQSHHSYDRIRTLRSTGEVDYVVSGHDDSVSSLYPPLPGPLERYAVRLGGTAPQTQSATQKEDMP